MIVKIYVSRYRIDVSRAIISLTFQFVFNSMYRRHLNFMMVYRSWFIEEIYRYIIHVEFIVLIEITYKHNILWRETSFDKIQPSTN